VPVPEPRSDEDGIRAVRADSRSESADGRDVEEAALNVCDTKLAERHHNCCASIFRVS
jgi:hypothetical protein